LVTVNPREIDKTPFPMAFREAKFFEVKFRTFDPWPGYRRGRVTTQLP
jgi:hypothetical protein